MRSPLAAFALALCSATVFAQAPATAPVPAATPVPAPVQPRKPPKISQFCAKTAQGTTTPDARGIPLVCRPDAEGKLRWQKQ